MLMEMTVMSVKKKRDAHATRACIVTFYTNTQHTHKQTSQTSKHETFYIIQTMF